MRAVGHQQLDDLALGSAILGAGGGGDPYVGKLLAQQAIREYGPVTVVACDEVPEDAVIAPVAMMGAPTIMVEKLPRGDEVVRAFETLGSFLGTPITHTISAEAGGINSTIPFVLAARTSLPVVDGDLMGRAFPELQMCLPTLVGIAATPMAIADEKGNATVLVTIDNHWTERLARSIAIDMGGSALISLYALLGWQLQDAAVAGSLSLCEELGRLTHEARRSHADPVDAIAERLHGHLVFTGRITDVARETQGGFARSTTLIEGVGPDAGAELVIHSQNEHLLAVHDGEIAASTPDLLIVLESETAEPITTERLRYGYRVRVLAVPCDARWRTADGLELVGPRYFGYDADFVPIEALAPKGDKRLRAGG